MTRQIANRLRYQGQTYLIYDLGPSLFTPDMLGLKPGHGLNTACRRGYYYEAEIIDLQFILTSLTLVGTHFPTLSGHDATTGEHLGMGIYKKLDIPILATGHVVAFAMTQNDRSNHATGKRVLMGFIDGVLQDDHLLLKPKFLERFRKFLNKS